MNSGLNLEDRHRLKSTGPLQGAFQTDKVLKLGRSKPLRSEPSQGQSQVIASRPHNRDKRSPGSDSIQKNPLAAFFAARQLGRDVPQALTLSLFHRAVGLEIWYKGDEE